MSIPVKFVSGVFAGLVSNIGLMKLNNLHKGCVDVCTLSQFSFGLSQTLMSSTKRKIIFSSSQRRIPLNYHILFAIMFFIGPWFGNRAVAFTEADFYPVFLVVRSCGSVTSMVIGYFIAGKRYTFRQIFGVLLITMGAGITTLGCYNGSHQHKTSASSRDEDKSDEMITNDQMFMIGVGFLLLNLINDSTLGVLQGIVFAPFLEEDNAREAQQQQHQDGSNNNKDVNIVSVIDESMAMMSFLGTGLMALIAGKDVYRFISNWISNPTWFQLGSDSSSSWLMPFFLMTNLTLWLPLEFIYLTINFVGNWNSRLVCTWLNGHATVVMSALVPMFYRLLSTIVSTQIARVPLPLYTWFGIFLVFIGSFLFLFSPKFQQINNMKKKKNQ